MGVVVVFTVLPFLQLLVRRPSAKEHFKATSPDPELGQGLGAFQKRFKDPSFRPKRKCLGFLH